VNRRDRLANLTLFVLAAAAWILSGYLMTKFDPRGQAWVLLSGALLLGAAIALTLVPIFWLAAFVRHRSIAYKGDWLRAGRRAALVGLVIVLFVILRGQDALNLPLALFIVVMAGLIEVTLSLRR
jgi:hypothetical protein